MMLNIAHEANWDLIKQQKEVKINKNNKLENAKRTPHVYNIGDKVLLRKGTEYKWETPNEGPFQILEVFDNGTVAIQKGAVRDTVNIRRVFPFYEKAKSNHGGECSKPTSKTRKGQTGVEEVPLRMSQRLRNLQQCHQGISN